MSELNAQKRDRLAKAVEISYRNLQPYRDAVQRLNEAYAGPMYGANGSSKLTKNTKFINLMKQLVSAYMTLLASNRPSVLLSTSSREKAAFAKHFQFAINNLLKQIEIEKTLNQWVRDAFFWLGIVKVHMGSSGQVMSVDDVRMDPGRPFASNIALDDFVYDVTATRWPECQFMGDMYRLPIETLRESDLYSGDALDKIEPSTRRSTDERLEKLSIGDDTRECDLEPMADVCDIWLPRDKMIYTFLVDSSSDLKLVGDPIAEMKWNGSNRGPYKPMYFDEVSENVMPCSTAADLEPLDALINSLFRKNARKASRLKENPVYTPAGADSARTIKNASDGEWIPVQDPRETQVIRSGGVDSSLQGFMLNTMEIFDRMGGNLQAMLGLGTNADTVGQEKLIHGAASRREGQLQNMFLGGTVDVIRELAGLLWQDETTVLPHRAQVEGLPGISYDATWKPGDREGEFNDYDIEIDVYSMQYQTPGSRIQKINELIGTVYMPMLPMIQQQGGTIDIGKLSELHAEMLNLPRLRDVILFNTPPTEPTSAGDGARKPPTSNRNYTRTNVSGKSSGVPSASEWQTAPKT